MENRVYAKKIDVQAEKIKNFYDKRAVQCLSGDKTRNTTVLLGDKNPSYADDWNRFEKDFVLPYLNTGDNCSILDIGCGVGRWAETLAPICKDYIGVDFSEQMVKVASAHFAAKANMKFIHNSFQGLFTEDDIGSRKFDSVIIAGVSMYINEKDLAECFSKLGTLLNSGAIVYMEESVGVRERLTLNNIWSEALNDNYAAIYRTKEEYLSLLKPLSEKCDIIKEDYFNNLDKKELLETSHWYIIMRKK